jgi:hypothetical protein
MSVVEVDEVDEYEDDDCQEMGDESQVKRVACDKRGFHHRVSPCSF